MSTPSSLYFSSEALQERFLLDAAEALATSRISASEHEGLLNAVKSTSSQASPWRVDKLLLGANPPPQPWLTGALLFSQPEVADAAIFLCTLTAGLERFPTRTALWARLRTAPTTHLEWEYERIDSSPFQYWSAALVGDHAARLQRFNEQFMGLPDLFQVVAATVQQRLDSMPAPVRAVEHPLQQVRVNAAGQACVIGTQSLASAALQDYLGLPYAPGVTRRMLDASGSPLPDEQAAVYRQALHCDPAQVMTYYEEHLLAGWDAQQAALRQAAHAVLAARFRHHLLARRHASLLSDEVLRALASLLPGQPDPERAPRAEVHKAALVIGAQQPFKLAGVWVLRLRRQEDGLWWYSPVHGLNRCAGLDALAEHLVSAGQREALLHLTSRNDHAALLAATGAPSVRLDEVEGDVFTDCVSSLIGLQRRNLAFALAPQADGRRLAPRQLAEALDIRAVVDPTLPLLGHAGHRPLPSAPQAHEPVPDDLPPLDGTPATATAWRARVASMGEQLARQVPVHEDLRQSARHVLNGYLALVEPVPLDAGTLHWQADGQQPVTVVDRFLERVSGCPPSATSAGQVVHTTGQTMAPLSAPLLEDLLAQARPLFATVRAQHQWHAARSWAPGPGQGMAAIERVLRLEAATTRPVAHVIDAQMALLTQVLDWPTAALRRHFGPNAVEVCSVTVAYDRLHAPVVLTQVFTLSQPAQPEQGVWLWSPVDGLRWVQGETAAKQEIAARLLSDEQWRAWVAMPEQGVLSQRLGESPPPSLRVRFEPIDGHFIEHLQRVEVDRQCRLDAHAVLQAQRWQVTPQLFVDLVSAADASDVSRTALDALAERIETGLFLAQAPRWIAEATAPDLEELSDVLQRYYRLQTAPPEGLTAIPGLQAFARQRLIEALRLDYPDQTPDPDHIVITLKHYIAAPAALGEVQPSIAAATVVRRESLTDYAINRYAAVQDATLDVAVPMPAQGPTLDAAAVKALVRQVDVGRHYRALLSTVLSENDPSYALRLRYFGQLLGAQLTLTAFERVLDERLSRAAYARLVNVLSMPDSLARLPVDNQRVVISPLLLRAAPDLVADPVLGMYVIKPATGPGSWVVLTLLDDEWVFSEFLDEAALLHALQSATPLAQRVLGRLDEAVRHVYDHGGFLEPHLPWSTESSLDVPLFAPAPPRLVIEPLEGNVYPVLFGDTARLLQQAATLASVSNVEADALSRQFLLSLGAETVVSLLPGRLALLVGAWQSRALFADALTALSARLWGRAVAEFLAGLGLLITARRVPYESLGESLNIAQDLGQATTSVPIEAFSWRAGHWTAELQRRLAPFEVSGRSLIDWQWDPTSRVFRDRASLDTYVVLQGKVYQARFEPDCQYLIRHGEQGPSIRLNTDGAWILDIGLHGGGWFTRLRTRMVDNEIDSTFRTEASGMAEIRQRYPDRARRIGEAHSRARHLLLDCRHNLLPDPATGQLPAPTEQILKDFFGVAAPTDTLLKSLNQDVSQMLQALLDPSLSPFSSERFVVGRNRYGSENPSAFIFSSDPLKRIFLSEVFFSTPFYRLRPPPPGQNSFNIGAHFRAAVLLHELSHVVNGTEDIAYLESCAPFLDLLEGHAGVYRAFKQAFAKQQNGLSPTTPREELFMHMAPGKAPVELRRRDSDAKGRVLKITGKSTLEEARDVFMENEEKRARVILANADSFTLLVTLLGRRRFTP